MNLQLKGNWQVFPIDKCGVDFLGYRFFHKYTLLRKSIKNKFSSKINNIRKSHGSLPVINILSCIMSYNGWFKYANCKNLQNKYIDKEIYLITKNICKEENIKNPLIKIT